MQIKLLARPKSKPVAEERTEEGLVQKLNAVSDQRCERRREHPVAFPNVPP